MKGSRGEESSGQEESGPRTEQGLKISAGRIGDSAKHCLGAWKGSRPRRFLHLPRPRKHSETVLLGEGGAGRLALQETRCVTINHCASPGILKHAVSSFWDTQQRSSFKQLTQ
ncbi:hypothetical protein MC885_018388 [Smutsia gigantea]|nr:hypothetical protein MC885_018388 [Smutsia gigantea]